MASVRFKVAMQSAFHEKFSHAMAIRGLLEGGSVVVRWMRAFAKANEMGRGGPICFREFVCGLGHLVCL